MERELQPKVIVSVVVTDSERVLMVQEAKSKHEQKWNLPGGHAIQGESIIEAAKRELLEEAKIELELKSLVGIYSSNHSVRFVFGAAIPILIPVAGHEIQNLAYFPISEIISWPDGKLVSPKNLKLILKHVQEGRSFPIDQLVDNR